MDIKEFAAFLLLGRIISSVFIFIVLKKQIALFKLKLNDPELTQFRKVLFGLSLVIFLGNLIPITIDTLTLFADLEGRSNPSAIGIMYAVSNCLTAITASTLIWTMYRLAARTAIIVEADKVEALEKHD